MKVRLVLIGLLLCLSSTYAQPGGGTSSSEDFAPPTVTPVSPEAGKIHQYGNIPVNMSAGQMSFQVPVFNIPIRGGYSWPVHLNYRYAGLVLEAKPSLAGLGWLLSGGGVVTREVRGIADYNPYGIYGTNNANYVDVITAGNDILYSQGQDVIDGRADTELDVYSVSVGGVSFQFKIDANNNPVYLSEHNYTVSFPNPQTTHLSDVRPPPVGVRYYGKEIRSFTVTDDQGIEYLFDQVEINEPKDLEPVYSENNVFGYFSAWQLTKVTFPNNQIITLSYQDNTYHNYDYSAFAYKNSGAPGHNQPGTCMTMNDTENGYQESIQYTLMERKLLLGLTFPTGSIELSLANNTARNVFTQILVKDSGGQVIYDYDLTYDGNRDVLTQVTKNGFFYYEFEYSNVGVLPEFLTGLADAPKKQDYWGFYNGRPNTYMINIPNSSLSADKRPNMFAAQAGAMTRIKYPTGGYTDIKYQQNQVKKLLSEIEDETYTPNRQILLTLETDNESSAPISKSVSFTYTFANPVIALVSHKIEGLDINSDISATITNTGCTNPSPPPSSSQYYNAAMELRTTSTPIPGFCVGLVDDIDPGGTSLPAIMEGDSGGYIKINAGTYTFSIAANNNRNSRSNGEILVQFYDPPNAGGGDPFINAATGGIRVKKITHVNSEGVASQQLFDYNDENGLSTGVELTKGQNTYEVDILYDCYDGIPSDYETTYRYFFDRTVYLSKYYNPVNLNSGVPLFYQEVKQFPKMELVEVDNGGPNIIVYPYPTDQNPDGSLIFSVIGSTGNDSGEDKEERFTYGYTDTTFSPSAINYGAISYPFTPTGTDLQLGKTSNVDTYKYMVTSIDYDSLQTQTSSYLIRTVDPVAANHPYSVKMAYKIQYITALQAPGIDINLSGGVTPPEADGSTNDDFFYMAQYREVDIDFVPQTVVSTAISSENKEVTTTTQNSYDDYFQLKETTITDSKGDVIKQIFYYPYDLVGSPYTEMVDANQIGKVTKQEVKENNVLHQTIQTNYASNNGDYKPQRLEGAKGSGSLEDRMFYEYDTYGNITQYYTAKHDTDGGGPSPLIPIDPVSFIWGYDRQFPVAKLQGIALSDIPVGHISTLQNTTNQTSLIAAQQALRDDPALAGAMVTTYTYDPFIGITSQTDPKGYTIFYEYDARDRIERIRNQDNQILKEFNYNLVTD